MRPLTKSLGDNDELLQAHVMEKDFKSSVHWVRSERHRQNYASGWRTFKKRIFFASVFDSIIESEILYPRAMMIGQPMWFVLLWEMAPARGPQSAPEFVNELPTKVVHAHRPGHQLNWWSDFFILARDRSSSVRLSSFVLCRKALTILSRMFFSSPTIKSSKLLPDAPATPKLS